MPAEPSLTDICSWHGFVNQLAHFLAIGPVMELFRELPRKPQGKRVYWESGMETCNRSFAKTWR
ncbi:hypothetical protein E2C01_083276 [Portunus trituberculatus]|uniref:Uncharacterized protein n=1 Tax=Portunus trituberculatus TaxID=210409 RepID=A0A5B7J0S1_PORTR|nr:hypothetical protein [Portunus trituberculatus]